MVRLLIAAFFMAGSIASASAETPREKYIKTFNYEWGAISDPDLANDNAPFFGKLEMFEPIRYYECGLFSGEIDDDCPYDNAWDMPKDFWFYSETVQEYNDGEEPLFEILPYTQDELRGRKIDFAIVPLCGGAFSTMEGGFVFATEDFEDVLESERRLSEEVFTGQFLTSIGADNGLARQIKATGLLNRQANALFREAWRAGRLQRPAIVIAVGECGEGGLSVAISFAEPTARFQIIPEFDYLLCQKFGLDPWNADQCSHVRDRLSDLVVLSGRYRVKITRKSGEAFIRDIDIGEDADTELRL